MRKATWAGCGILLMALVIGCGGDPVTAIINEEKAMLEAAKAGKLDPQRQIELQKKVANLTQAQKEEYARRKIAELGDLLKGAIPKIEFPKIDIPEIKLPEIKIPQ